MTLGLRLVRLSRGRLSGATGTRRHVRGAGALYRVMKAGFKQGGTDGPVRAGPYRARKRKGDG